MEKVTGTGMEYLQIGLHTKPMQVDMFPKKKRNKAIFNNKFFNAELVVVHE